MGDICGALRDLVPFVQFKNREKHPCRSVLLHGCFSRFLNRTNDTKSRNAPHIVPIERKLKQIEISLKVCGNGTLVKGKNEVILSSGRCIQLFDLFT